MTEEGFGDVGIERHKGFVFTGLKLHKLKVRPMFLSANTEGVPAVEDIGRIDTCLCQRYKLVGEPVLAVGPKDAECVFIGRDPFERECEEGIPFCLDSPGGKMLGYYLEMLGLGRGDCYITNTLFCRAPNNVAPQPDELFGCARIHAVEFKKLTNVKYIFTLGSNAFQLMTGLFGSVKSFVGKYYFKVDIFEREGVCIIPLHHPGSLLENESMLEKTTEILKKLTGLD